MDQNYIKELHIGDDLFLDARTNFNIALQKLLDRMMKSNAVKGTIALKMDVEMDTECVDDFRDGENRKRDAYFPKFMHSVSTTITEKPFEEKGNISPQLEIFFDEEKKAYQLKPLANVGQRSIFDDDFQENMAPAITDKESENSVIVYHYDPEYLAGLNLRKLKKVAGDLGIDVSSLDKKQDMIDAILAVFVIPTEENKEHLIADIRTEVEGEQKDDTVIDAEYTEPSKEPGDEETEDSPEDVFNIFKSSIGKELEVIDWGEGYALVANGENKAQTILLSSGFPADHPQYCSVETLFEHGGDEIQCVGYETDGRIISVAIECVDTGTLLFEMDDPAGVF